MLKSWRWGPSTAWTAPGGRESRVRVCRFISGRAAPYREPGSALRSRAGSTAAGSSACRSDTLGVTCSCGSAPLLRARSTACSPCCRITCSRSRVGANSPLKKAPRGGSLPRLDRPLRSLGVFGMEIDMGPPRPLAVGRLGGGVTAATFLSDRSIGLADAPPGVDQQRRRCVELRWNSEALVAFELQRAAVQRPPIAPGLADLVEVELEDVAVGCVGARRCELGSVVVLAVADPPVRESQRERAPVLVVDLGIVMEERRVGELLLAEVRAVGAFELGRGAARVSGRGLTLWTGEGLGLGVALELADARDRVGVARAALDHPIGGLRGGAERGHLGRGGLDELRADPAQDLEILFGLVAYEPALRVERLLDRVAQGRLLALGELVEGVLVDDDRRRLGPEHDVGRDLSAASCQLRPRLHPRQSHLGSVDRFEPLLAGEVDGPRPEGLEGGPRRLSLARVQSRARVVLGACQRAREPDRAAQLSRQQVESRQCQLLRGG